MGLKILHISPYYLPDVGFGGPVFSVSALCEALAADGNEVQVYTISYIKKTGPPQKSPRQENINGVNVIYFKGDWGHPCQSSIQLWRALANNLANYDIVHLHTWWNILIFRSIRLIKKKETPLVLSFRGMLGHYSFTHRKTWLKKQFQSLVGNQLLDKVALLATSEAEAREVALRSGRNQQDISVIPNMLGLKTTRLEKYPAKGFKLGFLSRLHHKKGIELLLKALVHCPEVDELIIGGRGLAVYEEHLKTLVEELQITHRVRWVGWIESEAKPDFFRSFHLFILPSFHENFANVVAEAWANGKATIVSNEVGLSDYVLENQVGWICEPNLQSIIDTIHQSFNDRNDWEDKSCRALKLVDERFTNALIVKEYELLYKAVKRNAVLESAASNLVFNATETTQGTGYVLGINAFHADASAAILYKGQLIAAIEEERFRRAKHWAGFPAEAIAFCLREAGIKASQVDYIAIGRDPNAKWMQKARFAMQHPGAMAFAMRGRLNNAATSIELETELEKIPGFETLEMMHKKIRYVEHHRCHLASAFFASPFQQAALLSIDGSGDFSTSMMGLGNQKGIEVLQSIDFPNSLGIFYSAFTQLLGFQHYGDEYKIMGLAPYGKPVYAEEMKKLIQLDEAGGFKLASQYFRPPSKGYILYNQEHQPLVQTLFSIEMENLFGKARQLNEPLTQHHKDLAASVQKATEDTIFHLLQYLHKLTGLTDLCIAGGVAQNSVANGKITSNTSFKRVFVPPAGHDAGLSIGAAFYVHHHLHQQPRHPDNSTPYTGSRFLKKDILAQLYRHNLPFRQVESYPDLCKEVVDCIAHGGVVGWFRGRCEFGPRALGNRSILADPRRKDAQALLNQKIKKRESFRPFAPAILKEFVAEYFECDDEVPYMEKVYPIRKNKQQEIPAVTHVDGTGRLQTVSKERNADFYQLVQAFYQKTGVPLLLNTSFNENEPIVNTPREAINCFLRTKMDMLVLENFILVRNDETIGVSVFENVELVVKNPEIKR